MNRVLKIIVLIVIVGGLIFAGYKIFQEQKEDETEIIKAEEKEEAKTDKKKEAALPVKVLTIKRGNLPLRLNISATADVWERATLKSELAGTIEKINFSVGDWVRKGQLLIKMDDEERALDVKQREAEKLRSYSQYLISEGSAVQDDPELTEEQKKELKNLKEKYLKAVKDIGKGKISQEYFEKISDDYQKALIFSGQMREEIRKAQEGLSAAIIALQRAQLNLKRTSTRSPFEGIIAELSVSKGEIVNQNQDLLRVVNLKTLYLRGFALESELRHLKEGTTVRIRFDSFPDRFYYGKIESLSPEIDPDRKTITIYIKVDNKESLFLPGMNAEIDVEYKVFENVIKVPRNAVLARQDRYLVFVVRDIKGTTGIANWEYVEVGSQNDEEIEIKSGIKEGDPVVIDGHLTLAHQSRVKITN